MSLNKKLLYSSLFLYPFQNFAFSILGSKFDISSFMILFLAVGSFFWSRYHSRIFIYFMLAVVLIELLKYIFYQLIGQDVGIHNISINVPYKTTALELRLLSGMVWFFGLFIVFYQSEFIVTSQKLVSNILIATLLVSVIYSFIQMYNGNIRPAAWFEESSFAGLSFYSCAIALLFSAMFCVTRSKKIIYYLLFIIFLIGSFNVDSMHIVTFLLVFSVFFGMKLYRDGIKNSLGMFFLVSIVTLFIILEIDAPHYQERLLFSDSSDNISMLSWVQGYDQAMFVISNAPLFGYGLGTTGFNSFESGASISLERLGVPGLTLTHAYSMFYRMIIEVGMLFTGIFLFFLAKYLLMFYKYLVFSAGIKDYIVFNFVFSFSLLIGILIKEPVYSRSYVFVAVLVFFASSRCIVSSLVRVIPPINNGGQR